MPTQLKTHVDAVTWIIANERDTAKAYRVLKRHRLLAEKHGHCWESILSAAMDRLDRARHARSAV